jgi:tetratricopeptide (TPR) repeat protein
MRSRLVLALGCVASVSLVSAMGGCGSTRRMAPPPAQRLSEANELAEKAERAESEGEILRAIELYQESVNTTGTVANWNNLGVLLMEQQNFAGAVSAFRRAAELEPTDPRPTTNMGIAFYRAGWAEDALDHFDRALSISPTYVPALRGAAAAGDAVGRATETDLERLKAALLYDADPAWRSFFERRRSVVQQQLREKGRREAAG